MGERAGGRSKSPEVLLLVLVVDFIAVCGNQDDRYGGFSFYSAVFQRDV